MARPRTYTFGAKQNDTSSDVAQVLSNGAAVDLTSMNTATLNLYYVDDADPPTLKGTVALTSGDIVSATGGTINVAWGTLLDTVGVFWSTINIVWTDTTNDTYPNVGGVLFNIGAR